MPTDRFVTRANRRGRIRQRPLVAVAVIALLLAIFTVGNVGQSTTASLRDTTTGDIATVQAASIKAVSDLTSPPSVVYSAGTMEKTGGLTITNSGTIDATYRTVTTATGAAPLLSGVRVFLWPSTVAAGCLTTPVNAITGTWASVPALSGDLPAGGTQFYCVKTALITPVGHVSNTAVTATFATTLSRSNWTSDASSVVTQSFVDASPSAPTNLYFSGTTSASTTLNWSASTDDVGVTGYDVYRGGTLVGSTTGATSLIITGLTASTSYSYTVKARDGAGHASATSPLATISTLSVSAPSGWFQLVNEKSKLCIDASGSGTANFTPLVQWTCSSPPANNQQWSFAGPNSAGYYTVVPRHSSAVIWDVEAASNNNAARIILYGANLGTNQQWSVIAVGTDRYQFVARNSGKCMSVIGGATAVNTGFEQVTCNPSDPSQTFSLRSAPAAPTSLAVSLSGSTSVSLSWKAPAVSTGVTGYVIYRDGVALSSQPTGLSYVDTARTPGKTYTYTVRAKNSTGQESVDSNAVSVAIPSTVPSLQALTCAGSPDAGAVPGYWLNYSWINTVKDDASIESYRLYVNGLPVGQTANRWADMIGIGPSDVQNVSAGIIHTIVLKQKLTNGQERTIGNGTVRLTADQWNNKLIFCR